LVILEAMIKNITIIILGFTAVLLIVFRPQSEPITNTAELNRLSHEILESKWRIMDLTDSVTTYKDSLTATGAAFDDTIKELRNKPAKELEIIKYRYIERGTDSSELLQTVTKFNELDQCNEQGRLKNNIIRQQSIKITVLDELVETLEERAAVVADGMVQRDKQHKKELRKTKIMAGVVVGLVVVLALLAG